MVTTWVSQDKSKSYYGQVVYQAPNGSIVPYSTYTGSATQVITTKPVIAPAPVITPPKPLVSPTPTATTQKTWISNDTSSPLYKQPVFINDTGKITSAVTGQTITEAKAAPNEKQIQFEMEKDRQERTTALLEAQGKKVDVTVSGGTTVIKEMGTKTITNPNTGLKTVVQEPYKTIAVSDLGGGSAASIVRVPESATVYPSAFTRETTTYNEKIMEQNNKAREDNLKMKTFLSSAPAQLEAQKRVSTQAESFFRANPTQSNKTFTDVVSGASYSVTNPNLPVMKTNQNILERLDTNINKALYPQKKPIFSKADIPAAVTLGGIALSGGRFTYGLGKGLVVDPIVGAYNIVAHPIDTIVGIKNIVTDKNTRAMIYGNVVTAVTTKPEESAGRVLGWALFPKVSGKVIEKVTPVVSKGYNTIKYNVPVAVKTEAGLTEYVPRKNVVFVQEVIGKDIVYTAKKVSPLTGEALPTAQNLKTFTGFDTKLLIKKNPSEIISSTLKNENILIEPKTSAFKTTAIEIKSKISEPLPIEVLKGSNAYLEGYEVMGEQPVFKTGIVLNPSNMFNVEGLSRFKEVGKQTTSLKDFGMVGTGETFLVKNLVTQNIEKTRWGEGIKLFDNTVQARESGRWDFAEMYGIGSYKNIKELNKVSIEKIGKQTTLGIMKYGYSKSTVVPTITRSSIIKSSTTLPTKLLSDKSFYKFLDIYSKNKNDFPSKNIFPKNNYGIGTKDSIFRTSTKKTTTNNFKISDKDIPKTNLGTIYSGTTRQTTFKITKPAISRFATEKNYLDWKDYPITKVEPIIKQREYLTGKGIAENIQSRQIKSSLTGYKPTKRFMSAVNMASTIGTGAFLTSKLSMMGIQRQMYKPLLMKQIYNPITDTKRKLLPITKISPIYKLDIPQITDTSTRQKQIPITKQIPVYKQDTKLIVEPITDIIPKIPVPTIPTFPITPTTPKTPIPPTKTPPFIPPIFNFRSNEGTSELYWMEKRFKSKIKTNLIKGLFSKGKKNLLKGKI